MYICMSYAAQKGDSSLHAYIHTNIHLYIHIYAVHSIEIHVFLILAVFMS